MLVVKSDRDATVASESEPQVEVCSIRRELIFTEPLYFSHSFMHASLQFLQTSNVHENFMSVDPDFYFASNKLKDIPLPRLCSCLELA